MCTKRMRVMCAFSSDRWHLSAEFPALNGVIWHFLFSQFYAKDDTNQIVSVNIVIVWLPMKIGFERILDSRKANLSWIWTTYHPDSSDCVNVDDMIHAPNRQIQSGDHAWHNAWWILLNLHVKFDMQQKLRYPHIDACSYLCMNVAHLWASCYTSMGMTFDEPCFLLQDAPMVRAVMPVLSLSSMDPLLVVTSLVWLAEKHLRMR